jgi:predicted aspartyl protease
MIRYSYNQQIFPPAPFVHVSLRCREKEKEINNLPAQLDTAADRTLIPGNLVEVLQLVPLDELPVAGVGGQVFLLPTYRVEISLRDSQPVLIEVIAHAEEPLILLGRDLLNQFRIVLDGPNLALELEA